MITESKLTLKMWWTFYMYTRTRMQTSIFNFRDSSTWTAVNSGLSGPILKNLGFLGFLKKILKI